MSLNSHALNMDIERQKKLAKSRNGFNFIKDNTKLIDQVKTKLVEIEFFEKTD